MPQEGFFCVSGIWYLFSRKKITQFERPGDQSLRAEDLLQIALVLKDPEAPETSEAQTLEEQAQLFLHLGGPESFMFLVRLGQR